MANDRTFVKGDIEWELNFKTNVTDQFMFMLLCSIDFGHINVFSDPEIGW